MTLRVLNIAVNDHCNNRCVMCNIWKNDSIDGIEPGELSRSLGKRADALKDVVELSLTGGEPFLRKDLAQIARAAVPHLPALETLFTNSNGTYPSRVEAYASEVSDDVRNLVICVSIDGDREIHAAVRGVDCYDLCLETIDRVAGIGKDNVSCLISTTLVGGHDAGRVLESIHELSQRTGVPFTFRVAEASESYYRHDEDGPTGLSSAERDEVLAFIEKRAPHEPYLRALSDHIVRGASDVMVASSGDLRCRAGDLFQFVQADGVVRPCIYSTRTLGKLSEGLSARTLTDLGAHEPCPCCTECTIYPMLTFGECGSESSQGFSR